MLKFAAGVVVGAAGFAYGKMVWENHQAIKGYNEAMTSMMNSVPPQQRFGYTEDFPKGQRWEL